MNIICVLRGHKRAAGRVWDDNLNLRSSCKECGSPMIRGDHGWRLFDADHDFSPERAGKPIR